MTTLLARPYQLSTDNAVGQWVANKIHGTFYMDGATAIGLLRGDEIVAGVIYENWNHASVVCHIAVATMTPVFVAAIFHYPFEVLGVRKIIAPVSSANRSSIRFVEKAGFTLEGCLRDTDPQGDSLLYTMAKAECRFLDARYMQRLFSVMMSPKE